MPRLICFDFDLTISSKHIYNIVLEHMVKHFKEQGLAFPKTTSIEHYNQLLSDWAIEHEEEIWPLVQSVSSLGTAEQWQAIFSSLAEQGHPTVLASFNPFQNILKRYLREVLGLTSKIIDQMIFVTYLPENPQTANKNNHIAQAIECYQQQYPDAPPFDASDIWLIDDSANNIQAAVSLGYSTILAKWSSHITQICCKLECPYVSSYAAPSTSMASAPIPRKHPLIEEKSQLRQTQGKGFSFSCESIMTTSMDQPSALGVISSTPDILSTSERSLLRQSQRHGFSFNIGEITSTMAGTDIRPIDSAIARPPDVFPPSHPNQPNTSSTSTITRDSRPMTHRKVLSSSHLFLPTCSVQHEHGRTLLRQTYHDGMKLSFNLQNPLLGDNDASLSEVTPTHHSTKLKTML